MHYGSIVPMLWVHHQCSAVIFCFHFVYKRPYWWSNFNLTSVIPLLTLPAVFIFVSLTPRPFHCHSPLWLSRYQMSREKCYTGKDSGKHGVDFRAHVALWLHVEALSENLLLPFDSLDVQNAQREVFSVLQINKTRKYFSINTHWACLHGWLSHWNNGWCWCPAAIPVNSLARNCSVSSCC